MHNEGDRRQMLEDLIAMAKKQGADAADALIANALSLSHAQRMGQIERLERSESQDLGLRVIIGRKQAVVSGNDWKKDSLAELVERAVAMARAVPDDPYCGLAGPDELFSGPIPDLDLFDPEEPSPETLIERAKAAEGAALALEGITNSEGAEASWGYWDVTLAASNGFSGSYRNSRSSLSVSVLAGSGTEMESDYDYSVSVYGSDLKPAEELGRAAGERALAKLRPKKGKTGKVPVIFAPRISGSLVGHLAGAVNGSSIARGMSFLKNSMGKQIMAKGLTVVDDPHRIRGLGSKPFDAEGVANYEKNIVDDGVLTTWLLDLATARQLGLKTTGNASRGASSPPRPAGTNLYMKAGKVSPSDLIADIESGFYVTGLMGMGVNGVTGDYSRGASGFWIEKGKITFPVTEMTIAGNLKEMLMAMTPANDLEFRYGTDAPTVRIDSLTVAGE